MKMRSILVTAGLVGLLIPAAVHAANGKPLKTGRR